MEEVRHASGATVFSLFFNAVFTLLILFGLNLSLRRFIPQFSFDNEEMLTIYIMVNMAGAICSYGMVPILLPVITYAFWGATPENEWRELFHRYIPKWLVVDDHSILKGYYRGEESLYTASNLAAWIPPLLWWSFFIFVLIFVMLCINIIVRRRWIEQEKLSYPIAEIPLNLVNSDFYNRLVWVGFAIAGVINLIHGLHLLNPGIPGLTFLKMHNIGYIFTEKPWNALRAMRISFIPSIIGLSFFMPIDLLFSCWFFYFYWQGMRILGAILSWRTYPGYGSYPYIVQESVGAYLAILAIAIFRGRRHFVQTVRKTVSKNSTTNDINTPMSYRLAWIGIICGIGILILFGLRAGMSINIAILFFLFYYAISTAITRLRAEIGFPDHDVHFGGPIQMITSAVGTANLSRSTLGAIPIFWFISRRFDCHIMPHQLEGFKIADKNGMNNKRTLWSMLFGSALGIVATFWILLHVSYKFGLDNIPYPSLNAWAREPWSYLQHWLRSPTEVNYHYIGLVGLGFTVVLGLNLMRRLFLWWPLHPIGYAVAGSYGMSFLWSCMLVSWVFKWFILRYGGLKRYRQAAPLFLGLVLGEFSVAGIWTIIGIALDQSRVYQFWI